MLGRVLRPLTILVVVSAAAVVPAAAQVQSGSVLVKIVDETGGAMPGTTITLTSPVLPRPLVGVADSQGLHRFTSLTIGSYRVTAAISGFHTVARENVVVLQNETMTIDITMNIGSLETVVTVTGESRVRGLGRVSLLS